MKRLLLFLIIVYTIAANLSLAQAQDIIPEAITADNVQNLELSKTLFDNRNEHTFTSEIAFNHDGSLLAIPHNNWIDIWDVEQGELIETLSGFENFVRAIAFHPQENLLVASESSGQGAIASKGDVVVWDVTGGTELARLDGQEGIIYDLSFSPNGRLIAGADSSGVVLWDAHDYTHLLTLINDVQIPDSGGTGLSIRQVGFANDNMSLIAGTRVSILLIYNVHGQILNQFSIDIANPEVFGFFSPIGELQILPDDTHILFGTERCVVVFDYSTGLEVLRLPLGGSTKITHHWMGNLIVHGGFDFETDGFTRKDEASVKFVDTSTKEIIYTLGDHKLNVSAIAFNSDYIQFASVDGSGVIRIWELGEEE